VVVDYCVDVAVKRGMAAGPARGVPVVGRAVVGLLRSEGLGVFKGLSAKTMEFATSYFVTGVVSVPVLAMVVVASADQGGGSVT
jgi:hypothetical protein